MKLRRTLVMFFAFGLLLLPLFARAQSVTHHVVFALTSADEADWIPAGSS